VAIKSAGNRDSRTIRLSAGRTREARPAYRNRLRDSRMAFAPRRWRPPFGEEGQSLRPPRPIEARAALVAASAPRASVCFVARIPAHPKGKAMTQRAIVIGSGLAGLTAAAALARHFSPVILLERDELPSAATPRPGVPQGRHVHGLLGGGHAALEALLPGFVGACGRNCPASIRSRSATWVEPCIRCRGRCWSTSCAARSRVTPGSRSARHVTCANSSLRPIRCASMRCASTAVGCSRLT
jgi:hypothetical protein